MEELLKRIRPVTEEDRKNLPVFSYSKLEVFKNCPLQYRYKYIEKKYSQDTSIALELGSLCHYVLERKGHMIVNGEVIDYELLNDLLANGVKETDEKTKEELIDDLLNLAFAEDIGDGDHTTLCCIPEEEMGKQHLLIKEEGIIAGVDIALKVFKKFDPTLKVEVFIHDGEKVKPGDIAFVVEGKVRSLLQTERLMLNIMQRMSGIATMTAKYAAELEGLKTKVLDTRKTTPGLRMLEKEAVKIGGGCNHRIGLFDMILLKDNHVDFAGGIKAAITKAKQYIKDNHKDGMKIEIEVRNFEELNEAIETGGIDRIMLDNFTPADTKKAVEIIAGRYETESSGGITFKTLREYGECGVDFISVGALTHSVKGLDMSFKAC